MADSHPARLNEPQLIHIILQVSGLAPYYTGESIEETRLSVILVIYNVGLATLVLVNLWFAENDPSNSGNYANKTSVIDSAYELIDWLGNGYVSFCIILSIYRYKKSCSALYFEVLRINRRYQLFGVVFDERKNLNYFLLKMLAMACISLIVVVLYIYFVENSGSHYTVLYWICVVHPKVFAAVVTVIFGSCALNLYQKLWVINEFLRTLMNEYVEKKIQPKYAVNQQNFNYDKKREDGVLAPRFPPSENQLFNRQLLKPKRKKPFSVFLENFPDCFEKKDRNLLGDVEVLREAHFEVLRLGSVVSEQFGVHFLFLFTLYFFGVIVNVYAGVTFHITGTVSTEYAACIIWTLAYVFMVVYLVSFCNLAVTEAKKTTSVLYKFWARLNQDDFVLKREGFAMQLANNHLEFTASGFFTVNSPLLFSFVVGVLTNVIFLIQFDKLNLQGPKDVADEKPTRETAQERLFGKADRGPPSPSEPPNYINATPHLRAGSTSLERHNNIKTNSYDSMSSYDSYNNRFGPNAHDDLKSSGGAVSAVSAGSGGSGGNGGNGGGSRPHDPYRYTRSTALAGAPHKHPPAPEYKYRGQEYGKPAPPPKSSHKPVPPPKPKNYRPPQQPPPHADMHWSPSQPPPQSDYATKGSLGHGDLAWSPSSGPQWRSHPNSPPGTGGKEHRHAKSFSLASGGESNYSHAPIHNGTMSPGKYSDAEGKAEIEQRGNPPSIGRSAPYYYESSHNGPRHNREVSGLDLANREQRGSAFELYKKPHYLDHNIRGGGGGPGAGVVASARGVFTADGGVLESRESGVSLRVPPGAIAPGVRQEIYFKVCQDSQSHLPPLDADRGETLLSPLVMCGPQGLKFATPVELRLPHRAATDDHDWALALQAGSPTKWQKVVLDQQVVDSRASNCVSVMVDHF